MTISSHLVHGWSFSCLGCRQTFEIQACDPLGQEFPVEGAFWFRGAPGGIRVRTRPPALPAVNGLANEELVEYWRCLQALDTLTEQSEGLRNIGCYIGEDGRWHLAHPILEDAWDHVEQCSQPVINW